MTRGRPSFVSTGDPISLAVGELHMLVWLNGSTRKSDCTSEYEVVFNKGSG